MIGNTYVQVKKFLGQGRKVLFTGTPCQIAGLKSYLGQLYENLFCVDMVCHGVPSPKVWQKYISYREKCADSRTSKISFRRKDQGWNKFSISFLFENNTEYKQIFRNDLYVNAFLKDLFIRPSCYSCQFKTLNRQSDITLADYWGVKRILPEMFDDKGTSLTFISSHNGQWMLEQIKDKMAYALTDINKAVSYNASAIQSPPYNPNREAFFKELEKETFDELVNKYCVG